MNDSNPCRTCTRAKCLGTKCPGRKARDRMEAEREFYAGEERYEKDPK